MMVELSEAEWELPACPSAEEEWFRNENRRALQDAMKKLPEQMREAVYLCYFEGLTYEDAAQIMKKNKKQVANLLYRAKEKLRTILGKDGEPF